MRINNNKQVNSFSAIYHPPTPGEIEAAKRKKELDEIAYKNERKLAKLPETEFKQTPDSVELLGKCRPKVRKEAFNYIISNLEEKYGADSQLVKALSIIKLELDRLENKVANHHHTDYRHMLIG
ncbi:MAG: hypothetical protein MJ180_05700 [Candidatus Gastranaerophilales bacterium]|nr:hypothetical protein [Candidatus Gastranaerophilales bacterium]